MKTIRYIGYYSVPGRKNHRGSSPASASKMDYIVSVLNCNGYAVEIVSKSNGTKFERGSLEQIGENVSLKLFSVLGNTNLFKRICNRVWLDLQFTAYLMTHIQKGDTVIAYHSMGYDRILRFLKKCKSFQLVLEVEEIYADVAENSRNKKREMKLFELADAYVFPTGLLDQMINKNRKPSVIIHGTYQAEPIREKYVFQEDPLHEKKHLLYAGTLDPRKGGAMIAAAAAEYLPDDYCIHILGFGSEEEKRILQDTILKTVQTGRACVTIDGFLSGEEYIRFVQSCDVGFSTQNPSAAFNDTSFPSKVLSYLANGLRVVSVRIPALVHSEVNDLLYYYDGSDPKAVAEAVMAIDWTKTWDSRSFLHLLDEKFVKEIGAMLSGR